jgi:hypothetical protein
MTSPKRELLSFHFCGMLVSFFNTLILEQFPGPEPASVDVWWTSSAQGVGPVRLETVEISMNN